MKKTLILLSTLSSSIVFGQSALKSKISTKAESIDAKVVAWRRDFHQNPELGNREFRTAEKIAAHLKSLGIEVQEKVAYTGVVGVLKGGKPGPCVLLRADMDGLPVTERREIPFKSNVTTEYNGQKVGVMHACGHDTHVAILMGVAEVLSSMKNELAGTVKFCFQPAEEGAPKGEEGGAELMIKQGVMENPKVDVAFGLHINSMTDIGKIRYRSGAEMAAVDSYSLVVKGKQTHGANPWYGIDPIVTASQIVLGFQTIISRNVDITDNPAIVTVGAFNSGIRENIIPEEAKLIGTIRTFSEAQQNLIHRRMQEVATNIAESAGATAELKITKGYPVTYNDPTLTEKMIPTLQELVGKENIQSAPLATGAEDFSFFGKKVPALFFFLGGKKVGDNTPYPHHTPDFYIEDTGLTIGVKALSDLTVDYFEMNAPKEVSPVSKKSKTK